MARSMIDAASKKAECGLEHVMERVWRVREGITTTLFWTIPYSLNLQ